MYDTLISCVNAHEHGMAYSQSICCAVEVCRLTIGSVHRDSFVLGFVVSQ